MTTPLTGAPASVPGTDKSAPAAVSGGVSPPRPTLLSRDIAMLGPRQREELARIYDARARFLERFADCIRKGEPRDLRNQEQLDDALLLDWKRKVRRNVADRARRSREERIAQARRDAQERWDREAAAARRSATVHSIEEARR